MSRPLGLMIRAVLGTLGVLTLLTAGLTWGCKDQVVVTCKSNEAFDPQRGVCYPCPAGYKVDKKTATCVVDTTFVDVQPADITVEEVVETVDVVAEWVPDDNLAEVAFETVEIPDLVEVKDIAPTGEVGSSCTKDTDCFTGLTCYFWSGGYCIEPDCVNDQDCPAGSSCLPLLENSQACFDACESDAECRSGYACKGLVDQYGITRKICHPLSGDDLPLGSACLGPEDCAGSLGCVPLGPAQMCTVTGCGDQSPCPEGSSCTIRGTFTLCLPDCAQDSDCAPAFLGKVACLEVSDVTGHDVLVCTSAATGLEVGELCYANEDCETSYCHLVVKGVCSDTGDTCGADGDCPQGFCVQSAANQRGICSKICGQDSPCPAGSYCVLLSGDPLCVPQCTEFGYPCGPTGLGMECTYGLIYYPQVQSGKTACVRIPAGDPGSVCDGAGDCVGDGECYLGAQGAGYCYDQCYSPLDCSFGTTCVLDVGECHRICRTVVDCPSGFECLTNPYSSESICDLSI